MACFGSLVLSILSRWLIQFYLYLSLTSFIPEISSSFLMTSLLILSSLVYPVTLLRKRISEASRRVMSLFVVTNVRVVFTFSCQVFAIWSADIQSCASLLLSILFSLGGLTTHPQNPHSWRTSLSVLVWPLSYGLSGLGGPTRNIKFPRA